MMPKGGVILARPCRHRIVQYTKRATQPMLSRARKIVSVVERAGCIAVILALLCLPWQARAATTLLPNGEQCFQATTGLNGMVGLLGSITGGTAYTAGTYGGVNLTGGSGTGATASIVVSAGAVASLVIQNPGINYVVGDVLSATAASIGGTGSGFSVPISSVAVNSSLAGGKVNMFIPNTTTPKATWKDSGQVTANTVPIILDANGCAIIYGTGSYRQQVLDSLGNLVFDQVTTDTSSQQAPFWAGTAGGTANGITLVDPGFNATDGSVINFTALITNTGPTTANPSSFGAITVLKDTTAGPVALIGGEIVATNPISMVYRASDNAFHLLNPVIQSASGATAPLCGATGLKITNSAGTPNTIINLTADQVVMQTIAGITINRSNVSLLAINISTGTSTSTANGMDGEAVGTSQWLNIWAIDNGAAPAGLVSTSATAPTMPSGYSYKCRLGAMSVDGSGNLFKQLILGNVGHWVGPFAATNGPPCQLGNGVLGTYSATSPVLASTATTGNGDCAPPTATAVNVQAANNWKNGTVSSVIVAPSTSYSGTNNGPQGSNGISPPLDLSTANTVTTSAWITLESANLFIASSAAGAFIGVMDWRDKVNAN